jgi:hypothetical protein
MTEPHSGYRHFHAFNTHVTVYSERNVCEIESGFSSHLNVVQQFNLMADISGDIL